MWVESVGSRLGEADQISELRPLYCPNEVFRLSELKNACLYWIMQDIIWMAKQTKNIRNNEVDDSLTIPIF